MTGKRKVPGLVAAILEARKRVAQAQAQLEAVHHLDPKWPDAFNEYAEAREARRQLAREGEP